MNRCLKILSIPILISSLCLFNIQNDTFKLENNMVVSAQAMDTVVQQNIDKMNSINSYSAEFVVDYVTPSRDYDEVVDTLNQIQEISDSICADIPDTYGKIKALHDYVCETVAYDHVASENGADFNTICLKNVLENKRSICAGYSNFFSALCNAQGIYCVNIRGSAVNNKEITYESLGNDDTVTNHEWTAVWYEDENRWVYVDCTWDSGNHYYGDVVNTSSVRNDYFDISVEDISIDHKAKIVDYRNFLDAVNYFNVDDVTTSENQVETTTTTSTSTSSSDKSRSASVENTTQKSDTTTIQSLDTSENTACCDNIIPITIGGLLAIGSAIVVRKKSK